MKAAGVCIGRPVLLTSTVGHQEVLSVFITCCLGVTSTQEVTFNPYL